MSKIRNLAIALESGISDLEVFHHQNEEALNALSDRAREMEQAAAKGPAYLRERAGRFAALVKQTREKIGYDPARYHPLHRQIDKMKDTDLVDFFSESLQKRVDRLVTGAQQVQESMQPGYRGVVMYELSGMTFATAGRVVRYVAGFYPDRLKHAMKIVQPREGTIEFFPDPEDKAFFKKTDWDRRLNLVIMGHIPGTKNGKGPDYLGLWCDSVVSREIDVASKKAERLSYEHRFVKATVKHGPETIYLVSF